MKIRLLNLTLVVALGLLTSCNDDDKNDSDLNTELVGNWKLIEVLSDSGDGSGTFTSVNSKKIITFENDGTITSNGTLCDTSINTDNATSGTYTIDESTFNSSDCNNPELNYSFTQNGNALIIIYPCFEACQTKYIKE